MTNLGDLPAWAQPIGTPAPSSKKRKDKKAKEPKQDKPAKADKAAKAEAPAAPPAEPVTPSRRGAASDSPVLRDAALPSWAGGAGTAPAASTKGSPSTAPAAARQTAAAEPEVEETPVVRLVIDPQAPVHPEYGRRITVQQFSTKRIEVFEHAAVRIEGPLSPNPPFETLMSISFQRPEEKRKGRLGKIIDKATATSYQALGEVQPLPEAIVTIVTDVRTHVIHEAPPSPEGITAGQLLAAAGELATASPAEQARVFDGSAGAARHDGAVPDPARSYVSESVHVDGGDVDGRDVDGPQLDDDTGDYSRDRVVELAASMPQPAAPPASTLPRFSWDLPSPTDSSSSPDTSSADRYIADTPPATMQPPVHVNREPVADAAPMTVDPLVAEITRAVEEAASTLSAPLQPMAVPPAGRPVMRSAADRLRDLTQLHRDGLVSDAEFEVKRQALLDEL